MITFAPQKATLTAPAKINLSLYVGAARADGYHPISSIMVPIGLYDTLAVEYEPDDCQLCCQCLVNGTEKLSGQPNLVTQLAHCFGQIRDIHGRLTVQLKKNIPLKAGLGGGSSDGAVILNWLNRLTAKPWDSQMLGRWAAQYSADTPFFLTGSPALVSGIGEEVAPLNEEVPESHLLLVKPPADYSTKQIYQQFDQQKNSTVLPASRANHQIGHNDLLRPALKYCPAIQTALDDLNLAIAKSYQPYKTISLSGSGSTCYALLTGDRAGARQALEALERHSGWFYALTTIKNVG